MTFIKKHLWAKLVAGLVLLLLLLVSGFFGWLKLVGPAYENFVNRDTVTGDVAFDSIGNEFADGNFRAFIRSAPTATKVKMAIFNQKKQAWQVVPVVPLNTIKVGDPSYEDVFKEIQDQRNLYQLDLATLWPRTTSSTALAHDVLRVTFTSPSSKMRRTLTWNFGGLLVAINEVDVNYRNNQSYYYPQTAEGKAIRNRAERLPSMFINEHNRRSRAMRMNASDTETMCRTFAQTPLGQTIIQDDDTLRAEYAN